MKVLRRISLLAILLSAVFNFGALGQTLKGNPREMKAVMPNDVKADRPPVTDAGNFTTVTPTIGPGYGTFDRPEVAGTCETAGPIEVESSGGTAAGTPTAYGTLQLAFAAINGGVIHLGTITIDVCGNTTETTSAALNQVAGVTSVSIAPAGGAARTITGAIAAGSPLIDLNGADNVTINGLNTGGNSLTISNTTVATTAGTSTIRFIADASTNTVTNTTILGSSTSTLATVAGTVLFSTGTTTGNDNNTISNNNIGPAGANLPSKAIMASGTSATIENDNALITGNNIFDFFLPTGTLTGINIMTGNEGWTISTNRFYQTAARTFTAAASRYSAVTLNNSTGTFTVSGNIIGFGAANGTGTTTISGSSNEFRGIDAASVFTTAATTISNNTITAINQTSSRASTTTSASAFIAVAMGTTDGLINATGNTIGSLDGSTTIVINETSTTASTAPVLGFYNFSFFSTNISGNNIGSITIASGGTGTTVGFRGILVNTTTGVTSTLNNNVIGGTTAATGITDTQVGSYAIYGIQSALPNPTITGNTIRNFNGASNGAGLLISSGILVSGNTGAATISQNTIHSLFNNSGAATNSMYAMSLALPTAANVVSRNFIHSLSITSTATGCQSWGISTGTTGTTNYQNNMIRLGIDAAGASVTYPASVIGIRESAGGINNFYFNSVYIGGSGILATPTAANSYGFLSSVTTGTRSVLDNIFYNARSNAVAGGAAHFAIGTVSSTGLTSNYNDLYVSGTDGAVGAFTVGATTTIYPTLAAYRTATGQEGNSISADPQYLNPTGTAATVDLHINTAVPTPIEGSGIAVAAVTDDFDGQARAGLTPTDIGADAGNFIPQDVSAPSITYTPLGNTTSTANRTISVTITDQTGVASGPNAPRIYFKRSADATYVSTQCVMTGGTATNGTYDCTIDYSLLTPPTASAGDVIQYFIVAQDTLGNLGSNPGTVTGASVTSLTSFTGTPNSYTILTTISGNKTVGAGGDYPTLTAAFAAINGAQINGATTLTLTDATYPTETFPLTLNANSGSSATNTVTIKPAAGVSPAISGSSASCIFVLNGADYTTIDGSNTVGGTSRDMTITNTNAGTSSAVVCIESTGVNAGATNNVVKNNNLVGSTVTATPGTLFGVFSGSTTISISSAGADNDNNTIQNNNITKTSYGIYSGGASAANKNLGTIITQNVMNAASPNNITIGGILVNFEDGVQITQNNISVLKNDGTTGTTGTAFGIALGVVPSNTVTTFTGSDVTNAQIGRNRISGVTQLNATGYSAFGIVINSVTSGTTVASNNMVSGVLSAATASDFSAGIVAGGGTGSTTQIYYNSVSMTGARNAAGFPSYGLAIGSGDPVMDVRDNVFYNTQTSTGASKQYAVGYASATFVNLISNYNDYFVTGANGFVGQTGGLGTTGTDRLDLAALQTATSKDANSISADPLFVNPASDLHITAASPLIDAGTPVSVTIDFDGQTRGLAFNPTGSGTTDIGADEFVPAGPTASEVQVGGRVTLPNGRGLFRARVTMVDQNGDVRMAFTNQFGYYHFVNVATGETYIFSVAHRRYQFANQSQVLSIVEAQDNINFVVSGDSGADLNARFFDNAPFDFDGDGRTDVAVFRPSENNWYIKRSSDNTWSARAFGTAGDLLAPADFDGDGKTDLAVYRPSEGNWYVWLSASNSLRVERFGTAADKPVAADYDGDGRADFGMWNAASGVWQVKRSSDGTIVTQQFGVGRGTVTPIASDRDGDGKADLVLFSESNGTWQTKLSSGGDITKERFGQAGDRAVIGDFDGDGRGDLAVFRAGENSWYIRLADGKDLPAIAGSAADKLVIGDFDGDGKYDAAGFKNGVWSIRQSVNDATRQQQFGLATDIVIPAID